MLRSLCMQYKVDGALNVPQSGLEVVRNRNVTISAGKRTPLFQCKVGGNNEQTVIDVSHQRFNHKINAAQKGQVFRSRYQLHRMKRIEKRTDWKSCFVKWRILKFHTCIILHSVLRSLRVNSIFGTKSFQQLFILWYFTKYFFCDSNSVSLT